MVSWLPDSSPTLAWMSLLLKPGYAVCCVATKSYDCACLLCKGRNDLQIWLVVVVSEIFVLSNLGVGLQCYLHLYHSNPGKIFSTSVMQGM